MAKISFLERIRKGMKNRLWRRVKKPFGMLKTIETSRLILLSCSPEILEVAAQSEANLSRHLNITIAEHWTGFGAKTLKYTSAQLRKHAKARDWWTYFPILKEEKILMGTCGYKGPPEAEGIVEIGYEIAPSFRNQGFATEITKGLVKNAFECQEVSKIIAHTLAAKNPSTTVLEKNGFVMTEQVLDYEEGKIWRWELENETLLSILT